MISGAAAANRANPYPMLISFGMRAPQLNAEPQRETADDGTRPSTIHAYVEGGLDGPPRRSRLRKDCAGSAGARTGAPEASTERCILVLPTGHSGSSSAQRKTRPCLVAPRRGG